MNGAPASTINPRPPVERELERVDRVEAGSATQWTQYLAGTSPEIHGQTNAGTTRVLIVDRHQVVAEALAALIESEGDMTVVGHAGSVADAIARVAEVQPDVVLMDLRLADETGARATAEIRSHRPDTRLVFLAREDNVAARVAALEAGASAFVHRSCRGQDVLSAIRNVAQGKTLFTPQMIIELLHSHRRNEAQSASLTAREREVLRLMANGLSSLDIARALGIAYTTVRSHIRNVIGKLGAHSKLEAILNARKLALIE